jgi:hypothetical protein
MTNTTNQTGAVLTCTNDDCGCRLRIEQPCLHGDVFNFACGQPFRETPIGPLTNAPT